MGALLAAGLLAVAINGCSSATRAPSGFGDAKDAGVDTGSPDSEPPPSLIGDDASQKCDDLLCQVDTTCGDSPTTLTGKVFDPAGVTPLYNAIVYIPRSRKDELPPIKDAMKDGVSCDRCGATAINPLAVALTNTKGEFTLTDVPVDKDVPIVVQIGKWRRKMSIDIPKRCDANKAPETDRDKVLRLPRNGKEGDMPHVAVTTGGCDQLECLLRGMGVDDSEFVPGNSTAGHIHMFQGSGGGGGFSLGSFNANTTFWNDSKQMLKYDITMLSCECSDNTPNPNPDNARLQMIDYVNKGGRAFGSHYHVTWMRNAPDTNFKNVATFPPSEGSATDGVQYIETQLGIGGVFPKGQAMAEWLFAVGSSTKLGEIQLKNTRAGVLSTNALLSQAWIKTTNTASGAPRYFSFNTPIGVPEKDICGRFVFADLHVMDSSGTFPSSCPAPGGLNAQQKALEFMFLDLSSCVQSDKEPPIIPT
jgi:hypothetical protein